MSNIDLNESAANYWKEIDIAYSAAKELFILSEEKLNNMSLFPAPLLEHRDALDHIMRYSRIISEKGLCSDAISELSSAKQHEIRAYFDIADYICISVRAEIAEKLNTLTVKEITKIWNEYKNIRSRVIAISDDIASIRNSRKESLSSIRDYQNAISEIFQIYDSFQIEVLPKIEQSLWNRIRKLFKS